MTAQSATGWPFPNDRPLARARKVAQAYRARLHALDKAACDALDDTMREFGETWIIPRVITVHPDDWLTPAEAADLLCIDTAGIRQRRLRGLLGGQLTPDGWRYRARDVLAAAHAPAPQTVDSQGNVAETAA